MFKVSKTLLVVESVEKAVKFYTEKMGFSLEDAEIKNESECYLSLASVRKGNAILVLKAPSIEELAEFGMIKRCVGRSTGMVIELNRGLEKYYTRCRKKGIPIAVELRKNQLGQPTFTVRDPFGLRLIFVEKRTGVVTSDLHLFAPCGVDMTQEKIVALDSKNRDSIEPMVECLRQLGLLKRVSQKFVRSWVRDLKKKYK